MKRYRKYLIILALIAGTIVTFKTLTKQVTHPVTLDPTIKDADFDISMGKDTTKEFGYIFSNKDDIARYTFFKNMFEKNLPSKVENNASPKIPKIIHQIWVGPKLPPPFFSTFQGRMKALHPDWEYHLWTETELQDLNLEMQDIIDQSQNYAEKSDIIRCELLERFGGVYLDVDMELFQPLDDLHKKYDFYAGLEHPHMITTAKNRVWVGISIIASRPHHPIIKEWKEQIRSKWAQVNQNFSQQVEKVVNHTYFPFTQSVLLQADKPGNVDIFFPASYFYSLSPVYASKRRSFFREIREKAYDVLEKVHLVKRSGFSSVQPESIAVHYWGNSWIPSPAEKVYDLENQVQYLSRELYQVNKKLHALERLAFKNAAEKDNTSVLPSKENVVAQEVAQGE